MDARPGDEGNEGNESDGGYEIAQDWLEPSRDALIQGSLRIGIAVSGGVDSMALAWLCASLARSRPRENQGRFEFHAFIVNHNARKESTLEAINTRKRLYHQIGTKSAFILVAHPLSLSRSTLNHQIAELASWSLSN